MIRPIDMGIILKNIDEVARINKNKEANLVNQQANALHKLEDQHRLEKSKVVNAKESIFNSVDASGEYNPYEHQAMMTESSDEVENDHIIQVLQKGYKLNGKVVRPAMVKVCKK